MRIPFINLKAQYDMIKAHVDQAIHKTLDEFRFIGGSQVKAFEEAFSKCIGVNHAIALGNGTDGLFVALKAVGVGPGHEVITPAWSWISSAETISLCGARPVFADVDPTYLTIDPESIERRITKKTQAIVCVHLYGQVAPLEILGEICRRHKLALIEDCAQGHLTRAGSAYAGSKGDVAAFSFYPTKNLGAYGDAGCVTTNDAAMAERMRRLANHGALNKNDHLIEGTNSRMDTLQAGILLAKLPFLQQWTDGRIRNANLYSALLKDVPQLKTPAVRPSSVHTFHLYVIRCQRRDDLKMHLERHGIETMIHYPKALTSLPAYAYLHLSYQDYPVASQLENEVLSLPIYPELEQEEIRYIAEKIQLFYNG
ncbi:MAG TPA: DegT/DnrJ/EryC1/StrS family aminotransferase [Chryseosolibacter sp.]|nr:DegT/DnrJ/EryC1/StrS family aminotransferase [Chryseosolibacter sp.]